MAYETLKAADPVTVPELVFDKVWVEEIVISAPDPNGDASGRIRLRKFAEGEDGVRTMHEWHRTISIFNLLKASQEDAALATLVDALMAYVGQIAIQEGVAAEPPAE